MAREVSFLEPDCRGGVSAIASLPITLGDSSPTPTNATSIAASTRESAKYRDGGTASVSRYQAEQAEHPDRAEQAELSGVLEGVESEGGPQGIPVGPGMSMERLLRILARVAHLAALRSVQHVYDENAAANANVPSGSNESSDLCDGPAGATHSSIPAAFTRDPRRFLHEAPVMRVASQVADEVGFVYKRVLVEALLASLVRVIA